MQENVLNQKNQAKRLQLEIRDVEARDNGCTSGQDSTPPAVAERPSYEVIDL